MASLGITIDNVHYNVGIMYESLRRSFEIVEGNNSGTNLNARTIRDIMGTKYKYEMTIIPIRGYQQDYDNLYYAISAPIEYHVITVPFGQRTLTYQAKITSGTDVFMGFDADGTEWRGLQITFEAMEPVRT